MFFIFGKKGKKNNAHRSERYFEKIYSTLSGNTAAS